MDARRRRLLVAEHLASNDRELYLTYGDGPGVKQLTKNTVDDENPSISPDERLIAFDRGAPGNQDLYTMRVGGGGLRRLTTNRFVSDVEPSWSPDGASIAFASTRSSDRLHIFVLSTATGHVRRLTSGGAVDTGPDWSPDGAWVAFTSRSPDGETTELWAVRPNGKGLHRLPAAPGAHALAWAPGGRAYAYLATEPGTDPSEERTGLFVTRNGLSREIRANVTTRPSWSPDGARVLWGHNGAIQSVAPNGADFGLQTSYAPGTSDQQAVQRLCDVLGTARNDVLVGTPGDDVICGFAGNDVIRGGGGNDTLIGGDGNDTLVGGYGADLVFGGNGNDVLRDRDRTRDVLDGGPGRNRIAGDGFDTKR